MTRTDSPEQAYFRQIEDTFIRLRGAPFLLSPSDWRLAQSWYDASIPVDVVCAALETVFERRRERGAGGKVQSLRYCAAGVESAWRERLELGAVAGEAESPELDVEARLANLARALPPALPERQRWDERVRAAGGDAQRVEEHLAVLDRELIDGCVARLDTDVRQQLEASVDASLASLRERLAPEVLAGDRERLLRERARRQAGLPLLSLFSPDAVGN